MQLKKKKFGKMPDGRDVYQFTMKNQNGVTVKIINYGGIITSILMPDKSGVTDDVVLGFDSLDEYLNDHPYIGALIGRFANRINKAKFDLNGNEYKLAANNGSNHLHGGIEGFDKKLWEFDVSESSPVKCQCNCEDSLDSKSDNSESGLCKLVLTYYSPDKEEGYPGNLTVKVTYSLNNKNELKINYFAQCDAPTPVNLTQHTYFNLSGGERSVLEHDLLINASRFTVANSELIPTGEIADTAGGAMDFSVMKPIGKDIEMVEGGYDHNYIINEGENSLKWAAVVWERHNGRRVEVLTTHPGVQFYSGNFLDGSLTGKGVTFQKHWGMCLETQHFPDSPNQPRFPNTILNPGEVYDHETIFRFEF